MSLFVGYKGDLRYGKESSFRGGDQSVLTRRFGYGQTISRLDVTREVEDIRAIGDRRLQEVVGKAERHSIGVSAYLSAHDELGIIMNYDSTNNKYTYKETPDSYAVGVLLGGTGGEQALLLFKGAVPREFELSGSAGEAVKLDVSFQAAELDVITSGVSLPAPAMGNSIYVTWSDQTNITLNTSAGAFSGYIRSFSLTVGENPRLYPALGDRRPQTYAAGAYEVTLQVTALFSDAAIITDYLNVHDLGAVTIALGDATGNAGPITLTLGDIVRVNNLSMRVPNIEPAELTLTIHARTLAATVG